ncbi:hypothetical protein HY389_02310 [Candidatus Daviesbacteria bacterium]|nr:hypothetical protein [Candidatus Daviesbacteria bacterium]
MRTVEIGPSSKDPTKLEATVTTKNERTVQLGYPEQAIGRLRFTECKYLAAVLISEAVVLSGGLLGAMIVGVSNREPVWVVGGALVWVWGGVGGVTMMKLSFDKLDEVAAIRYQLSSRIRDAWQNSNPKSGIEA